jgi:hypothetical protein
MMRRIYKRAVTSMMLGAIFALIMLAIAILGIGLPMLNRFLPSLSDIVIGGATKTVNPPSIYTIASTANFERLNEEIGLLLKDSRKTASSVIPFSLGQYRLVGFNRDYEDGLNRVCLSGAIVYAKEPKCKDKACLCLCQKEDKCSCVDYPGVDYFITKDDYHRYIGKKIEGLLDSVTGQDTYCLYIRGADSEEMDLKVFDGYDDWFKARNLYVEKTEKDGKTYIFIDNYDDVKYGPRMRLITGIGSGTGSGTGAGSGTNPEDLPTDRCGEIASCLDYKDLGIWGVDWETACGSSICKAVGSSRSCVVAGNSAGQTEAENKVCIDADKSIDVICLPNAEGGFPYAVRGDYAKNRIYPEICMECRGIGRRGANEYGWFEGMDPTQYCAGN